MKEGGRFSPLLSTSLAQSSSENPGFPLPLKRVCSYREKELSFPRKRESKFDVIKNLSVNNNPPFRKGGLGGFFQIDRKQIPLCPPFSKGDLKADPYLRISSKNFRSWMSPFGGMTNYEIVSDGGGRSGKAGHGFNTSLPSTCPFSII